MLPIDIYRQEIFNFLKTVCIKFKPFANYYKNLKNNCDEDSISSDSNNPYYRNLNGEYTSNDSPIMITAIETNEEVILSRNTLLKYPKTASIYKIPFREYDILCDRYPNQKGLIKSIIYPAKDIRTVIEADNLSLLAYDSKLLHINERESLIQCLKDFLLYMNERWYVREYTYEELYAPAFWSILWMHLPQLLLAKRIDNLHTSDVHPFHIWEYLESKGLKNYSSILTNKQSLWLYRNINYIYKNQGKASNLLYLADNLLSGIHVDLVGKTLYQQQWSKESECMTVPEYISEEVVETRTGSDRNAISIDSYESMSIMNKRLFNSNLETQDSLNYVDDISDRYSLVQDNILPTKLVEIQKKNIDSRYEQLLMGFLMDSMMYRYSENDLTYTIKVQDPLTSNHINLTVGEAIALFNWVAHSSLHGEPVLIPNKYVSKIAVDKNRKQISDIPKHVYFLNVGYQIDQHVDVNKVLTDMPNDIGPFNHINDFSELMAEQFSILKRHTQEVRCSGELIYMKGMCSLYDEVLVHREVNFELTPFKTYDQWFSTSKPIKDIIDTYSTTPRACEHYDKFAIQILLQLLPIDIEKFREFIGISKDMNTLYNGLKNLFIQLCSYNITFLDTDRDQSQYVFLQQLGFNPDKVERVSSFDFIFNHDFDLHGGHIDTIDLWLNMYPSNKGSVKQSSMDWDPIRHIFIHKRTHTSYGFYNINKTHDVIKNHKEVTTKCNLPFAFLFE